MGQLTKTTYALVVAIEHYPNLSLEWQRKGLNQQAAAFVKWLLSKEVPPTNIRIFRSTGVKPDEDPFRHLSLPKESIRNADKQAITEALKTLPQSCPDGTCLIIYWVGHGFVDINRHRRLLLADALDNNMSNLDLESVLGILRSPERGSLESQIGVFDSCAQVITGSQFPDGGLAVSPPLYEGLIQQEFYFAVPDGKYAVSGVFGPAALRALKAQPEGIWPPTGISEAIEKELGKNSHLPVEVLWTSKEAGSFKQIRSGSVRWVYANILLFLACVFGPVFWLAAIANIAPWTIPALAVLAVVWAMIPVTPLAQYVTRSYLSMFSRQIIAWVLAVVLLVGLLLQFLSPIVWAKSSTGTEILADLIDVNYRGQPVRTNLRIRAEPTALFLPLGGAKRNLAARTNGRIFCRGNVLPNPFPWLPRALSNVLDIGAEPNSDTLAPSPIMLNITDHIPAWKTNSGRTALLELDLNLEADGQHYHYRFPNIKPGQTIRLDSTFVNLDPSLDGTFIVYRGQLALGCDSPKGLTAWYVGKWVGAVDPDGDHMGRPFGIDLTKGKPVGIINWETALLCENRPDLCK